MSLAAIALGANLPSAWGPPEATLREALHRLAGLGRVVSSSFYETAPVGYTEQPRFLNAAALLETPLGPLPLLRTLLAIERELGRDRSVGPPKGPRTLDLDLLLYFGGSGDADVFEAAGPGSGLGARLGPGLVLHDPALTLPHPAMGERRFVLVPLAEIAPGLRHPVLGRTVGELLAALGPEAGPPCSEAG